MPADDDAPHPTDHQLEIDCDTTLSPGLVARLTEFCAAAEDSPTPRVCLIRLRGGTGTRPWPGDVEIHMVNKWELALRRLERLDAVTVVAAEGHCAGPAFEVLLAADYRIATDGSRLRPPSHGGGAWPGMALYRLASQLGPLAARRLLMFTDELTAADAERFGLLDETGADLTELLAARIPVLRRQTGSDPAIRRRLLLDAATISFEDALGPHLAACDRALRRGDPPVFGDPAAAS